MFIYSKSINNRFLDRKSTQTTNNRFFTVLNRMNRLKHQIGIFFGRSTLKNYRNKIVIKNLLSLSYGRCKSMRYPESPKVTPRWCPFKLIFCLFTIIQFNTDSQIKFSFFVNLFDFCFQNIYCRQFLEKKFLEKKMAGNSWLYLKNSKEPKHHQCDHFILKNCSHWSSPFMLLSLLSPIFSITFASYNYIPTRLKIWYQLIFLLSL